MHNATRTPTPLACPTWCDSTTEDHHWTTTSDGLEVIHTHRHGTVTVHLYAEVHHDGTSHPGAPAVVITHDPHTQQIQHETILSTEAATTLARDLTDAAAFAAGLSEQTTR